ncbi:hypothetical protein J7337_005631 [Fusarium musae]|uniref:DNA2/NAM7 helicase-like C-terminal domain-containing protein n=1 Tax=Fusarium musae TaxID=1042133 RepID=A0A9P8DJB0_9HYPO|nr:hypothetical protein J7337_005631 [Fusarium musae]KAG9502797.1 hypothetical protein J7337_005631 [Fusarium musae]
MIRPDNCSEAPHGTPFYNDGYANLTIQLIIQFYRPFKPVHVRDESRRASVPTIAAYRSQMHDDQFLLDQVASAELPKSLINVRTIDDSLNHEADYVFIDLTRTVKHGCLKNAQRINVPASRAQSALFSSVSSWGCLSTTLMIRPDNAEEMKTGNSFANPANANFAMQLVVQLHRDAALVDARDFSKRASVLIPTPYKGQKHLYDILLRQLTKAEVPQDLAEVRTVDDSPSHEADFVILD